MNRARQAIAATLGLGVLVAGCASAAHLKALQPAAVPSSPAASVPEVTTARPMLRGIDIDAYTWPGQDIKAAAAADIAYVKSLHANAVSVSFPFYMAGPHAAGVYATRATPSPAQLAVIARDAARAGLYVSARPLLDEANLGYARADLHLRYPRRWFASYRRFLLPYARMAQLAGVSELVTGTELTNVRRSPLWGPLNAALRRVYRGTLAFDSNWWGNPRLAGAGGTGVQEAVDAYPPVASPLTAGWEAYDATLPRGTVESEVGIAAAPGAFARPWLHQWPGQPVTPQTQARWFAAACQAAAATHLGGIYFWSIPLSARLGGPTGASPLSWADSAGARAIAACFASLDRKASA